MLLIYFPSITTAVFSVLHSFRTRSLIYSAAGNCKPLLGVTINISPSGNFSLSMKIGGLKLVYNIKIKLEPIPTRMPYSNPITRHAINVTKKGIRSSSKS